MLDFAGGLSSVSPDLGRSSQRPASDEWAPADTVGQAAVGHRLFEREDEVRELESALDEVAAGTGSSWCSRLPQDRVRPRCSRCAVAGRRSADSLWSLGADRSSSALSRLG